MVGASLNSAGSVGMRDLGADELFHRPETFDAGMAVRVVNVTSAPELNGQVVDIVRFSDKDQRWIVKLRSTGKGKALKEENLVFEEQDEANKRFKFQAGDHIEIF